MKMNDLDKERTEQLIKEREEYEKEFFRNVIDEMMMSDSLDKLIADRLKYIDNHFDFEPSPEYKHLEELYYAEYEQKLKENDSFDNFEEIDYPDDPNEINSRENYDYYPDVDFEYEDSLIDLEPQIDELIDAEASQIPDMSQEDLAEFYEQLIQESVIEYHEEENIDKLIQEHIEDEKFFENTLIDIIEEEYLFEKAIDEIIFDEIDIDYEPDLFDYEEDDHWYNNHFDMPDESIIDPFDNFDEVDYPEEPPSMEEIFNKIQMEQHMEEIQYQEALEEDYAKYKKQKEKHVESLIKDYFTKDDTLDMIIKEKLKEKKFNH